MNKINPLYPNVILVDDQPSNIVLLRLFIEDLEINIYEAESGYNALELFKTTEFALILLDISMPGIDGFETLERIRNIIEPEKIPTIFISAYSITESRILQGIEDGAIDFVQKPINKSILCGKVKQYIDQYRKQKELDNLVKELEFSNIRLRESENRFRNITHAANDSIIVLDENLRITFWNRASKQIFGYLKPEAFNEEITNLLIARKSYDKFLNILYSVVNNPDKGMQNNEEIIAKNKIGYEFPVEISLAPIKTGKKKNNIVLVIRDISQRKRMEREALKARDLREANKVMKEFIDNVSHEMRTPMNAVLGISQMILKHSSSNLTEQQIEGLNLINTSGSRLLNLINDVLDISKIESRVVKVENEEFDFYKFITTLKSVVLNLIETKDVRFVIRMSKDIPEKIFADQKKLNQILINLLGNSVKFTEKGKIALSVHRIKNYLFFEIFDTGIGISEEDQKKVFDRFHQVDGSNAKYHKGTGLGLNICKKTVEILGGQISVKSTLGESTLMKFSIKLPEENKKFIDDNSFAERCFEKDESLVDVPSGKKVALIIEDDSFYKMHFESILARKEYFVISVTDGKDGLQSIYEIMPEVVFLNLETSSMSGYNIIKKVSEYSFCYTPEFYVRSNVENFKYKGFGSNITVLENPDVEKEILSKLSVQNRVQEKPYFDCLYIYDQDPKYLSLVIKSDATPFEKLVVDVPSKLNTILERRNFKSLILVCTIKDGIILKSLAHIYKVISGKDLLIHCTQGVEKKDLPPLERNGNVFFVDDALVSNYTNYKQLLNYLKDNFKE